MATKGNQGKVLLTTILFATGTTILKKLGTHYFMEGDLKLTWRDVATVLATGTVTYFSFRNRYDEDFNIT